MRHWGPVHSVLFSTFVPLAVYARNRADSAVHELVVPIALILFANLLIQLYIRWRKIDPVKANVVVSAAWLAFFLFRPALQLTGVRIRYGLLALVAIAFVIWLVLTRARASWLVRGSAGLALAAVLVTLNPLRVVLVETWSSLRQEDTPVQRSAAVGGGPVDPTLPDVYYIILDAYTSASALRTFFQYDIGPFEDSLRSRGFYVASGSKSNYPKTALSLSASLNMDYVPPHEATDHPKLRKNIHNSLVFRRFKAQGYHIAFATMTGHLRPDANAYVIDENIAFGGISGLTRYHLVLINMTPARLLLDIAHLTPLRGVILRLDRDGKQWNPEAVDWIFDKIARYPARPEPTFLFAHVLSPHAPFYHDGNCRVVDGYQHRS